MPKLFLFPGAHKTGTTLLQEALHAQTDILADVGVSVIRRNQFHLSPVFDITRLLRRGKSVPDEMRESAAEWASTITDETDNDLVLSVESLFGEVNTRFYGNAGAIVGLLQDLFPGHDFVVKYYVRRQDTYLTSSYLQKVHKGNPRDGQQFTEAMLEAGMSWTGVLNQIADAVGRANVKVHPFEAMSDEGIDGYVADFFSTFVGDKQVVAELVGGRPGTSTNISVSEIGLRIALDFFREVDDKELRLKLMKVLQRHAGVDKLPRAQLFGPDTLAQFREKYAQDNDLLFTEWGLAPRYREYYSFG